MSELAKQHLAKFGDIRHIDDDGNEYWLARQLAVVLDYVQFRNFLSVVDRAREACRNSGLPIDNHFADVSNMVPIGSGAEREVADIRLSRYACYLIVQNGDPAKPIIALGQTYFAVQARRQELQNESSFQQLSEDGKRVLLRQEMAEHNKALSAAAKASGVDTPLDYAVFQDHGYRGLYGGLGAKDIHQHKGLKKSQKILDHMGSTELAANLFRATQTEEKLRRDNVRGKRAANQTHMDVGKAVRKTIADLGGAMPERLPTPDRGIGQIEREQKKALPKPGQSENDA